MPINYNTSKFPWSIPWFMFDIDNLQLITTVTIPEEITDEKEIVLSETPIPGLNYSPIQYGGGGNRKIGFTLPIVKRNNTIGHVLLLKQMEQLRNQAMGLLGFTGGQFESNPKVLYYWGTGSVPLIYYVKKCDFTHSGPFINELGNPQLSYVDFELWLDETNILYKAEEIFRKLAALTGTVVNAYDVITSQIDRKQRTY